MKEKLLFTSVIMLSLLLCAVEAGAQLKTEGKVQSYETVDTTEFNRKMEKAGQDGENWTKSYLSVALKFAGDHDDFKTQIIETSKKSAEGGNDITVMITREGLLDDSTQAIKYKLQLTRDAGGNWRVTKASRAMACRAGRGSTSYSTKLCQ